MMNRICELELEYHAICNANPDYDESLWDFLRGRGNEPDDIWEYSPEVGRDAGQKEPDWL